jgi:hypothetical protein
MNKEELEKQRDKIIKKWEASGLLDNLDDKSDKIDLTKLMDGKASQLINDDLGTTLYSEIEYLIIMWRNDGTKTAGSLTREIMKLINENKNVL